MTKERPLFRKVVRTGLFVLGLYFGMCWFLSRTYLSPVRTVPVRPAGLSELSIAGTPAWLSPALTTHKKPGVVVVLAHGYGGNRSHWSEVAEGLHEKGYVVVIPAMPAHDASPFSQVGFGPAEAKVIGSMVDWAHAKGASKVIVGGVSMGGAATWLATQETPHIDGVFTEGAYARFSTAMSDWLNVALPGGSVLLRPVVWFASWQSGVDPASIRPVDAAATWKKPALIIQAEEDRLIRSEHAEELANVCGKNVWTVGGAEHANCYSADPEAFEARVFEFIESVEGDAGR